MQIKIEFRDNMNGWSSQNSYPEHYFRFTVYTKNGRLFEVRKLDHGKKYCIDGKTLETLTTRNWNINQYKGNHKIEININKSHLQIVMDGQILALGNINKGLPILPTMIKAETMKVDYDGIVMNFLHAPVFTKEPKDFTVKEGSYLAVTANAVGNGNLKYQWFKNNTLLNWTEFSRNTLYILDASSHDVGEYYVTARNEIDKTISKVFNIDILDPPIILKHPVDIDAKTGEKAQLTVLATGKQPFDYQWYKNGIQIEGANSNVLNLNNVTKEDEAVYSVRIKNKFGKAISRIAKLKREKPGITLRPPTIDASGRLVLIANGPLNRKVIFQFSNDLVKWNDQLTLPLSDGTTTYNVPIQSSPNAPNLFYRLKLVE